MFQPDAVFVTDSEGLKGPVIEHLVRVFRSGIPIPYPELDALIRPMSLSELANSGRAVPFETIRALLGSVGVNTRMPRPEAESRLRPHSDDIVRWTLGRIAAVARQHGAVPVFIALNVVGDRSPGEFRVLQDADAAGFLVFNLLDLWQDRDKSVLRIAEWDKHPNAQGNRVIADRLFELIQEYRSDLRLGKTAPALRVESRASR